IIAGFPMISLKKAKKIPNRIRLGIFFAFFREIIGNPAMMWYDIGVKIAVLCRGGIRHGKR
ncbi:MAG: hypothetical protein IJQ78_01395, partial [Selenomonadaceae bacterium]|nr:hypothetical protein [Selenomonadaceae bacterium]